MLGIGNIGKLGKLGQMNFWYIIKIILLYPYR